jgi:hypothetical protein
MNSGIIIANQEPSLFFAVTRRTSIERPIFSKTNIKKFEEFEARESTNGNR